MKAHTAGNFLHGAPGRPDLDQPSALDRTEQRDPVERELPLEVGNAVVQVPRWTPKRRERLNSATRAPLDDLLQGRTTANGEGHVSTCRVPFATETHSGDERTHHREIVLGSAVLDEHGANG